MEPVWLLPPNWAENVRVTDAWRTGMLSTPIGNEQRAALFAWPRLTQTFTVTALDAARSAWITRALFGHLHHVWRVPIFSDGTLLSATAASGQPYLTVTDTRYRRFRVGSGCILIDPANWRNYATGTIHSMTDTSIRLTGNLSATWTRAWVYPLFTGILSTSQQSAGITSDCRELEVNFAEFLETAPTAAPTYSPVVSTYLSEDLFELSPDWVDAPILTAANAYRQLAYLGVGAVDSLARETRMGLRATWTGLNREDAWAIREFFMSRRGRWGRFWIPTWQQDIRVTAAIGATDDTITIEDVDYVDSWSSNDCTGRHLYFRFPDGTSACRAVTGAAGTTLNLDSAVGVDVPAALLSRLCVSFLLFARFEQDEIEGEFKSMDVIDYQLGAVTIPDEAPSI